MNQNPLISVIVPIYNTEKYLRECLDSLINQTYKNLQIILINDGSKDKSGKICEEYAGKDSRIIYKRVENGGVSSARNKGLALATGDYYHFPDSDDYLELDTYEYLLGLINIHKCDSVVFEHFVVL
jgi:glycosyltransferase involved in cell wall biosynthesis